MEEVEQFFMDSLKKADYTFCHIKLFRSKPWRIKVSWENRIMHEIDLLTWSKNQFQKDRDKFIQEIDGAGSMDEKLRNIAWKSDTPQLLWLPCTKSKQLWYGATRVAIRYDINHKLTSNCCPPSMLYSLIRIFVLF